MEETEYFKKDLFGLKTLRNAGKIKLEKTDGKHMEIYPNQLIYLVNKIFK